MYLSVAPLVTRRVTAPFTADPVKILSTSIKKSQPILYLGPQKAHVCILTRSRTCEYIVDRQGHRRERVEE